MLLCLGAANTLHASYWGWRFNSKMSDTEESIAREKAEAEAEERAKIESGEKAREEAARAKEEVARAHEEIAKLKAEIESKNKAEEKEAEIQAAEDAEERAELFSGIGSAILWYIPNRICDLVDCFTFEVGVGEIGLDLSLTRYATFGAGVGYAYITGFGFNNQNGLFRQQNWYADFLNLRLGETDRKNICGDYKAFRQRYKGEIDIEKMKESGCEDPYAIGVKASCYAGVNLQLHPVEFLDFLAGFIFIDIKDDDK